ncbi:MAG: metallopeptidase family protein [Opitutales bacterium]
MRDPGERRWERLKKTAEHRLDNLSERLPGALREVLQDTPVLLEGWAPPELGDGLLGLCEGVEDGRLSENPGPIHLYLYAIAQYAAQERLDFAEEVERTLLHELGHRIGFDEDDLDARGMG